MAKELPYFKFEPNQWENGNIQICSREDKGLYLDLCSMYWSRLGDVPLKLAIQKLCAGNANAFDSLIDEDIFDVIDGMICIHFLNEQLSEFKDTSERNQKIALDGWAKRRKDKELQNKPSERNANASKSQCETDAIREEERREEETLKPALLDKHHNEKNFLKDWNELRFKHLKKKTDLRMLSTDERDNFNELFKNYSREEMQEAVVGLFKQKKFPRDSTSMTSNPKHFLKFFNTYFQAYNDKNMELYGKKESVYRLNIFFVSLNKQQKLNEINTRHKQTRG